MYFFSIIQIHNDIFHCRNFQPDLISFASYYTVYINTIKVEYFMYCYKRQNILPCQIHMHECNLMIHIVLSECICI